MHVSVIIPTLNEEIALPGLIDALRRIDHSIELIVADGGSDDRTCEVARAADRLVTTAKGRGTQQAAGASIATGEVLWFLHADSVPNANSVAAIREALANPSTVGGNFTLRFDGDSQAARTLSWIYPLLRPLGLCYGDSGIFVRRQAYVTVGGFGPLPLFEDVDLVKRLRRAGRLERLPCVLKTSCRRFEHRNVLGMFAQWTSLQILYWLGASPDWLARRYAPIREHSK
ncbi:MAG: TIGR04283 family arsenosugar biosynthesis glycosyltransferase [Acidobacteria bacterium]|nr:TIGR04283 family arsenosugar biosynthesis glycosyltransferase [Acidobacteriota bacterium]